MLTRTESNTLTQALSEARVTALPKPYSKKSDRIWLKAIVHVIKCDNSRNFAIAVNDGAGNPVIIKDFGKTSRIVKIDGLYPFLAMSPAGIPNLQTQNEIISYLSGFYKNSEYELENLLSDTNTDGSPKTEEQKKNDREEVKKKVYHVAIQHEIKRVDSLND